MLMRRIREWSISYHVKLGGEADVDVERYLELSEKYLREGEEILGCRG